jgi:hypothetical protein
MDVRAQSVMRLAVGATFAFVLAEFAEWPMTFLPPVFFVVVLTNIPGKPTPQIVLNFSMLVAASALIAILLGVTLQHTPAILFGITALMVFRLTYAIGMGAGPMGPVMLMICITTIPVAALESPYVAGQFALTLARAAVVASLTVLMVSLLWPKFAPPKPAPKPVPRQPALALRNAVLATAILAPLMLMYLMFGNVSGLPALVATVMIVASLDVRASRKQALGYVKANLAGGLFSIVLIFAMSLNPSLATFTLVMLAASLMAGWRITRGDAVGALMVVALNACIIVLSSSIGASSGIVEVWLTRLSQFLMAAAVSAGMMALLWPRDTQATKTMETSK